LRWRSAHRHSTAAGPCDAVIDIKEAEDREVAAAYFFFRRFAFVFFAAAFAFLFFAMLLS